MVTMVFSGLGSYASPFQAVFLQVEVRSSHGPSRGCRWLGSRAASSRETSRLIADPLNYMLRLNVIFLFFLTNFDFSLYTNKLKENFFGDDYWDCPLYGMQCSPKCSTAQVLWCETWVRHPRHDLFNLEYGEIQNVRSGGSKRSDNHDNELWISIDFRIVLPQDLTARQRLSIRFKFRKLSRLDKSNKLRRSDCLFYQLLRRLSNSQIIVYVSHVMSFFLGAAFSPDHGGSWIDWLTWHLWWKSKGNSKTVVIFTNRMSAAPIAINILCCLFHRFRTYTANIARTS
jgi:hypothetical protein